MILGLLEIDEWIEDNCPYDSDFEIISKEKFLSYGYYKDLVNYDFGKIAIGLLTNFAIL